MTILRPAGISRLAEWILGLRSQGWSVILVVVWWVSGMGATPVFASTLDDAIAGWSTFDEEPLPHRLVLATRFSAFNDRDSRAEIRWREQHVLITVLDGRMPGVPMPNDAPAGPPRFVEVANPGYAFMAKLSDTGWAMTYFTPDPHSIHQTLDVLRVQARTLDLSKSVDLLKLTQDGRHHMVARSARDGLVSLQITSPTSKEPSRPGDEAGPRVSGTVILNPNARFRVESGDLMLSQGGSKPISLQIAYLYHDQTSIRATQMRWTINGNAIVENIEYDDDAPPVDLAPCYLPYYGLPEPKLPGPPHKPGDYRTPTWWYLVLGGILAIVAGMGVLYLTKRRSA